MDKNRRDRRKERPTQGKGNNFYLYRVSGGRKKAQEKNRERKAGKSAYRALFTMGKNFRVVISGRTIIIAF